MKIKKILVFCIVWLILLKCICCAAGANDYPTIEFSDNGQNSVTIRINPGNGYEVAKKNIIIKVDGTKAELTIRDLAATVTLSDSYMHKINVAVMNSGGFKAVAVHTFGSKEYTNTFSDIGASDWAKKYITYMNHYDIISGTRSNGKIYFYPRSNITRGEFAVMIANMLKLDVNEFKSEKLGTADESSVPSWCINHAKALSALGIMSGRQNGNVLVFDHSAKLTRAEAATVIAELLPDNVYTKKMNFKDAQIIPAWSYDSFEKLTSLGIISGYQDGTLNPKGTLTRSEAIKLIYEIF